MMEGKLVSEATSPGEKNRRFFKALKEIDGTFVRTFRSEDELFVEFHSPSISDFMRRRMGEDSSLCKELVAKASFFGQLDVLLRLSSDGSIARDATGNVDDIDLIAGSISRLLDSESVQVINVRSGNREWLARHVDPVGARLLRVSRWGTALNSSKLFQLVLNAARALQAEDEIGRQSASSLSSLLRAVDQAAAATGAEITSLVDDIALSAMKVLGDFQSTDDWISWSAALKVARGRFTKERYDAFRNLAKDFCFSEGGMILDDASNEDDATSWVDDLASVADSWGIEFGQQLESLHEAIAERFPSGPEPDYELRGVTRSRSDDSDAAIDDLFDSLKH